MTLTLVNVMHITASVYIDHDEYGLHQDCEEWVEKLAPHAPVSHCRPGGQLHNRTGEDNADAHMKRQIMGSEVVVAVTEGRPDLALGSRFLRGDRWAAPEAGAGQDHRRIARRKS